MICQIMGLPPISTIGLGRSVVFFCQSAAVATSENDNSPYNVSPVLVTLTKVINPKCGVWLSKLLARGMEAFIVDTE